MGESVWRLSAFGDEVSDDLQEQLMLLRTLGIGYLELRGVWGKNVLHLTDAEVKAIAERCDAEGIAISAIGSPVGKTPITQPLAHEIANLKRIFAIADALGTQMVRVFSFYPPAASEAAWTENALVEEAVSRLKAMTEAATAAGIQLLLENEHGIVGDTITHCKQLLDAVNSPTLAFAWDPQNFVHVGEETPTTAGWVAWARVLVTSILKTRAATGEIVPAGEGDGQIDLLLQRLDAAGYTGFLALEPHLTTAGRSSGFSGKDGMQRAATALRTLLARLELKEQPPTWAEARS